MIFQAGVEYTRNTTGTSGALFRRGRLELDGGSWQRRRFLRRSRLDRDSPANLWREGRLHHDGRRDGFRQHDARERQRTVHVHRDRWRQGVLGARPVGSGIDICATFDGRTDHGYPGRRSWRRGPAWTGRDCVDDLYNTQIFTTPGATAGASIPITSATPNFAYASGLPLFTVPYSLLTTIATVRRLSRGSAAANGAGVALGGAYCAFGHR